MENRLSLYTDILISHRDIFIRDGFDGSNTDGFNEEMIPLLHGLLFM